MKNHDQLIESVFDAPEALSLDGLDSDVRKEAAFLNTLKCDLRRLRDVPECQLTVEHLQHAVLNQRPTPTAKPLLRFWTWVPVAAAATLALVMVTRPSDIAEPASVSEVALERPMASTVGSDTTTSEPVPSTPSAVAKIGPSKAVRLPSKPERVFTRRTVKRASETITVAAVTKAIEEVAFDGRGDLASRSVPDSAPAAMTLAVEAESRSDTPVVVVGDTPNPETGAAEAQEISRPSDVVFGG